MTTLRADIMNALSEYIKMHEEVIKNQPPTSISDTTVILRSHYCIGAADSIAMKLHTILSKHNL